MTLSFDSLVMPPIKKRKSRRRRYQRPHAYNYRHPTHTYNPIDLSSLKKMIATPHKQTLYQRLMDCERRLRQKDIAVTTTKHVSPRRRSRRRSPHRSRRRSPHRSRRRRRPSPRRSRRRSFRP